jgi:hypothetical protein
LVLRQKFALQTFLFEQALHYPALQKHEQRRLGLGHGIW